jgi:hypothetical protein
MVRSFLLNLELRMRRRPSSFGRRLLVVPDGTSGIGQSLLTFSTSVVASRPIGTIALRSNVIDLKRDNIIAT